MARLTQEEIERLKAAGAAKREARKAKREAMLQQFPQQEEKLPLPSDFEDQLHDAWYSLERMACGRGEVSEEKMAEIPKLFLPEATEELRFKAYKRFFHDYEALIFYSWRMSEKLCDAAYAFWDEILSHPDAKFSGNSIVRIIGGRPNKNLLKIMQKHRGKFFEESAFARVLKEIVLKHDRQPGLWNFEKMAYDPWTPEEKQILEEIKSLF